MRVNERERNSKRVYVHIILLALLVYTARLQSIARRDSAGGLGKHDTTVAW